MIWLVARKTVIVYFFTHRLLIHVNAGSSLHEDSLHQPPQTSRAGQTLPPSAVEDSLPGASSGKYFWNQGRQQGHGWWWWWGALLAKPGPASFPLLSWAQLLPPPAWELTNRSLPAQLSCYSLHLLLWGLHILWSCNIWLWGLAYWGWGLWNNFYLLHILTINLLLASDTGYVDFPIMCILWTCWLKVIVWLSSRHHDTWSNKLGQIGLHTLAGTP